MPDSFHALTFTLQLGKPALEFEVTDSCFDGQITAIYQSRGRKLVCLGWLSSLRHTFPDRLGYCEWFLDALLPYAKRIIYSSVAFVIENFSVRLYITDSVFFSTR